MGEQVAKILGEDMELGNFLEEENGLADGASPMSGEQAARALLDEIDGVRASRLRGGGWGYGGWGFTSGSWAAESRSPGWSQDWGRKFLPTNGGSAYIDLAHLELCIPEVRSAFDAVAAHHAMLRIASEAQRAANERCDGGRYQVLAANSDRLGNSYGSHVNVMVTREAWDDLFLRKLHPLLVLAAFQVSSIVLTGQGKVGSENRQRGVPYQISQRADFFESLTGAQTTYQRPIVNSRDESLCGRGEDLARLHCIFYDNSLCQVGTLLKFGGLQIVLAMIEAGHADLDLALDDPVAAVTRYSHDPDLTAGCKLASGERVTAVALQRRFLAAARRCADAGVLDIVPRADEILALWEGTLDALAAGDVELLAGRLDWVLKRQMLERAVARNALSWDSADIHYLDLLYSSLDHETGLYWAYEVAGRVESVVSEAEIERFTVSPPDDTRAWTRAELLRRLGPERIESIDWDEIELRLPVEGGATRRARMRMDDPRELTRAEMAPLLDHAGSVERLLERVLPPEQAARAPTRRLVAIRH